MVSDEITALGVRWGMADQDDQLTQQSYDAAAFWYHRATEESGKNVVAPDADHPYGHERFETVATLGLSIFLAIVGTIIIFEGFCRFHNVAIFFQIRIF